jgi:predicted phosphodiesterase
MRLALVSDIHANLEALTAVLKDIEKRQVDEIACLGDVIGYGADPAACLDLVESNCRVRLMGNHEWAAIGEMNERAMNDVARRSMAWTREQLEDRHVAMIEAFRMEARISDLHLVHASPFEPENWHYVLTPKAATRAFEATDAFICFFGHSHLPTIFSVGEDQTVRSRFGHDFQPLEENRYLVNVGSVGQPRDDDSRSCYVVYDSETFDVYYHRVAYDFTVTQKKLAEANAPALLIERLAIGR